MIFIKIKPFIFQIYLRFQFNTLQNFLRTMKIHSALDYFGKSKQLYIVNITFMATKSVNSKIFLLSSEKPL